MRVVALACFVLGCSGPAKPIAQAREVVVVPAVTPTPRPVVPVVPVPADPAPSTAEVTQLVVGSRHTCALHADGAVSCWGDNSHFQLGTTNTTTTGVRATPIGVPAIRDAVELATSIDRTCARLRDATVECWGTLSEHHDTATPEPLAIGAAAQIRDRCARTDGEIQCTDPSGTTAPIAGITDAVDFDAGWAGGCAIRAAGTVTCWTDGVVLPVKLAHAIEIASAGYFGCARLRDQTVWCWDLATHRAVVAPMAPRTAKPPAPRAPTIEGLHRVAVADAIALIEGQPCAIRADRTVVCGLASRPKPLAHLTGVRVIAIGNHSCAGRGGRDVVCWGDGDTGALGIGWAAAHPTPTPVPSIDDAVEVAVDDLGSCARHRSGRVSCWGATHQAGAIGSESAIAHDLGLTSIAQLWMGGGLEALDTAGQPQPARSAIAPLAQQAGPCVLTRAGRIACYGNDPIPGQAGDSLTELGDVGEVVEIAAAADNDRELCFRRRAGTVTCFGGPTKVFGLRAIATITDATQLAVSAGANCALRADHSVWCWQSAMRRPTALVVERVAGLTDATQLSVSSSAACAVRTGGTIACWGDNSFGQLGDPTLVASPTPRNVAGVHGAVQVAVGLHHACAVLETGAVWCWGRASNGQLGTLVVTNVEDPQPVVWP